MSRNFTDNSEFIAKIRDFLTKRGHVPTDLEKSLLMYISQLQQIANKATAVALHYNNTHPGKCPRDHLDEVYSFLREEGLIEEDIERYDAEGILEILERSIPR